MAHTHMTTRSSGHTRKPSLMERFRARRAGAAARPTQTTTTVTTTTTTRSTKTHKPTAAIVTPRRTHHQKRRPSLGDKLSGAMLKLKGSLTGKRGAKGAGTRRMHGSDGRGSHRVY